MLERTTDINFNETTLSKTFSGKKPIKKSLIVSALALLFTVTAFGPKSIDKFCVTMTFDNGLGMALAWLGIPLLLMFFQFTVCSLTLFFTRHQKEVPTFVYFAATIFTIPIAIFGFIMFLISLAFR